MNEIEPKYQVKIIELETLKEEKIGYPTEKRRAERVVGGIQINLDHSRFLVDCWLIENKLDKRTKED